MKLIIGFLMIIAGVALGIYVGGYLCLYSGIVTIIEQIALVVSGGSVVPSVLAWAIVRLPCAGAAGALSATVLVLPGAALFK